ncbi:MAG: MarR family winged helix-turn-helix transcriptional regulator [Solirubrobacteraceae bacterium]|jgi:DNA-binding MarR family transcriptional regulator
MKVSGELGDAAPSASSADMSSIPRRDVPADMPARLPPPPGSDAPFRSVGFSLSSIGYAVARRFRETLAPLALEPREFALLRAVGVAEGISQQAAGERLQIPPSRMVAFVDALEARQLLERRHDARDRRKRALYLTPEGRQLLERALELATGFERHLCARLSDAEREQLLELLLLVGVQLGVPPGAHAAHLDAAACADE